MIINPSPVTEKVIGCAVAVHKTVGPGLLESAYELCLTKEFLLHEVSFERQVAVPLVYRDLTLDCVYRADFVVESKLIIEVKSVDRLTNIHDAQILTYMKLLGIRQGMLMNFNQRRLVDGLKNFLL
jgi:GxxExxY protein